jgi:hypothetical protein
VVDFKYLKTAVKNRNDIHDNIQIKLSYGNACYNSGQNLLFVSAVQVLNHIKHRNNYKEHSPVWAANIRSARQEVACVIRNLKVHYRVHSPPPDPILSQMNPTHPPTLLNIGSILILPQTHAKIFQVVFSLQIPSYAFSALMRIISPAHIILLPPSLLYNGYRGSFPGAKARPGRDADHSPPSSAEVVNE